MSKKLSNPLVGSSLIARSNFSDYRTFPEESREDKIRFSKLINTLKNAKNSHEKVLNLSLTTFGKLINSDHFPNCTAHIEIKYIRDFFFNEDWDHLRKISFANQNLSYYEISIIMLSIIHDRGSPHVPAEIPIIKQLSCIDISGNNVLSETLDFFSLALVDLKKPEKTISGMLQVDQLNVTNCTIKPDDKNVATLRSLGITVITDKENSDFAPVLGMYEPYFNTDMT